MVKLAGAADKLERGLVKTAVHKLNAYLQQFTAVVPNGITSPCFLVATDLRDGLVLHGWVAPPD